ncbi:MAG: hypothetical protein HRF43_14885 [Phycisphaerae bacterium]
MSDIPLRHRSFHRTSSVVTVIAVLIGAILLGFGLVLIFSNALLGALLLCAGIILGCFALILNAAVMMVLKAEANVNRIHHSALDLLDVMKRLEPMIQTIADNSQISDAARSIAHRARESEALRQAIREEMYGGNWEGAYYLIDEMERRFGYKLEAQKMRDEMSQIREMTIEDKITQALHRIEALMSEFNWERARQESERLMRLFPRHERVMKLPAELQARREAHKQELLTRWRQVVERNEIDEGIAVLTELDKYLTPEEAQELRDSARDVFKARLLNMGVQFSLAVQEGRWRDALEVGLLIRQEFPNSRMAQEVSEKIEILRVRSGFIADADLVQARPQEAGA